MQGLRRHNIKCNHWRTEPVSQFLSASSTSNPSRISFLRGLARSCLLFVQGSFSSSANAGEGGTVHKVGDGFDFGRVGGVLDEGELVDALDI